MSLFGTWTRNNLVQQFNWNEIWKLFLTWLSWYKERLQPRKWLSALSLQKKEVRDIVKIMIAYDTKFKRYTYWNNLKYWSRKDGKIMLRFYLVQHQGLSAKKCHNISKRTSKKQRFQSSEIKVRKKARKQVL